MAKKPNYFQNVAKEINDSYQAYRRTEDMSQTPGPGTDAKANVLRGIQDRQVGQLAGAVFMGARYDAKGRRIKG
jgi:hypothetical protein